MRAGAVVFLTIVGLAACGGEEEAGRPTTAALDCAYPLVWDGATYDPGLDLPPNHEVGPSLGTGVVLGCGDISTGIIPDERVDVSRVEGMNPAVAVAATPEGSTEPLVWLGRGYLLEDRRHPLHDAAKKSGLVESPRADFTCGPPLETRARSLSTPRPNVPLEVQAEDPDVESLLTEPGTQRVVSLTADTVISGLERHGVPYVERGDEFTLVLRACEGNSGEPGVAGLRLLYADRLTGE
jgi:hypothetical protein